MDDMDDMDEPKPRKMRPEALRGIQRYFGFDAEQMRILEHGDLGQKLDALMPRVMQRLLECRRAQCLRAKTCVPRHETDMGACFVLVESRRRLHWREIGKVRPWSSSAEALARFETETAELQQDAKEAEFALYGEAGPSETAQRHIAGLSR